MHLLNHLAFVFLQNTYKYIDHIDRRETEIQLFLKLSVTYK